MAATRRYNTGRIGRTAEGTWMAFLHRPGKQYRKTFKKRELAEAWIDAMVVELDRGLRPLDAVDVQDAQRARELLRPGVSLTDAVRFYNAHNVQASVPWQEAVDRFLADKRAAGLRYRSLQMLEVQLDKMAKTFDGRLVSEISTDDLTAWLDAQGYRGNTRDGYRRTARNFFGWCQRRGLVAANPAEGLTVPRVDESVPGILTVEQTRALLDNAAGIRPRLVPFLAVCLFAGIRPAEADQLDWADIGDEHITIGSRIAKTRRQRYVTVEPVLAEWLRAYRHVNTTAGICDYEMRNRGRALSGVRKAAGIDHWPHDAMRHSFATYHLAKYQDAGRTALEMGHTGGLDVLFRHYRAMAKPAAGEAFFSLFPAAVLPKSAQVEGDQ